MCLTLKRNYTTYRGAKRASERPKIAKKDIVVYKILKNRRVGLSGRPAWATVYQNFKFSKGYHYYQEVYKSEGEFGISFKQDSLGVRVRIDEGLHAWTTKSTASRNCFGDVKIFEMIIPKGSKYYLGRNGDIVSNNLIWKS